MEQHHGSHIDIVHHSIDHIIDGPISISSSVHQLSRIDQHQFSNIDGAICSIDHEPAIIDHGQCRIERIILSVSDDRQSPTDRSMATEHRWRIDMEQHHGSYVDIVHHSIDHVIDGSISISSSVHQCCQLSNIECSRIDSAICSIDHEPAIIDHGQCRIERIVLSVSDDRQSPTDRSMATEHRWRIDMESDIRSHVDIVHHSIDHVIDGPISISSSVHQCR